MNQLVSVVCPKCKKEFLELEELADLELVCDNCVDKNGGADG